MDEVLRLLLASLNETLTTAIVVLTVSLLLYNITRSFHSRVARTSGVVLLCVAVVSVCDVLISLGPGRGTTLAIYRAQWIGIALIPAATFHLSDALLATTGLPSRGRRRNATRLLYLVGALFILCAAFTDLLVRPAASGITRLEAETLFGVYLTYFAVALGVAFINAQRARQRCLTRDTRRRMGYLQYTMWMPAFGIFPLSLLLGLPEYESLVMLFLVNIANTVLILMLLFLAYPLSFFGSTLPDRVVKTELLRFMLRGPATALLALGVIIFTTPATRILGLPGNAFTPFAVVTVVLLWQWFVALRLSWLERRLIYANDDSEQLGRLQSLGDRLLTRSDLLQVMDDILAATCDYLQVPAAFTVSLSDASPEIVGAIGARRPDESWLEKEQERLRRIAITTTADPESGVEVIIWNGFWMVPLVSTRRADTNSSTRIGGLLGMQSRADQLDFSSDERAMLETFARRAADTLDDLSLQREIDAVLEGLLPQFSTSRSRPAELEYRPGRQAPSAATLEPATDPEHEQLIEQVRAALRHYWGGPGLTSSRLLDLSIVRTLVAETAESPAKALRTILQKAIDMQRPPGEQKLLSSEWMVFNILQLRFIERYKVRDVAVRLALSEPDLYRKQRVAIEAVANTLVEMERSSLSPLPRTNDSIIK